jgi:hypothetical protein
MAIGGCEVVICLAVRLFICLSPECARVTFAEQISGLTSRHAWRTPAVTAVLQAVALALGGRAGARLTGRLAAAVSRMTLIRLIRAMPDPAASASPRVLGVDEFALRKGHSYGTLLVDVETRRPVDILDERSSESFAAMARRPPGRGVHLPGPGRVLCRRRRPGRAGCGAGSRQMAPVAQPRRGGRARRFPAPGAPAGSGRSTAAACTAKAPETAAAPAVPRTGRIADRTRSRHADVHRMLADGSSLCEIAAALGLSRNTVRRFARTASADELLVHDGTGRRPSILERAHALPA